MPINGHESHVSFFERMATARYYKQNPARVLDQPVQRMTIYDISKSECSWRSFEVETSKEGSTSLLTDLNHAISFMEKSGRKMSNDQTGQCSRHQITIILSRMINHQAVNQLFTYISSYLIISLPGHFLL
ncbi:hypothetical protein O6H91_14G079900 [Diphasiastrum complanatum]|uniref:Uncharacterized protein n=1 Tax=Diphasiastrum complanatum TaxID=34168 RepID=A0ACC2BRF1_DIPCM|nr:hypothetical protein O6H91_14G079900 [Diphasiastrum complanatum]